MIMDTKLTIDEIELDSTDKAIDWEQRRYEIAKDTLAGIISVSYTHLDVYKRQVYIENKKRTRHGFFVG